MVSGLERLKKEFLDKSLGFLFSDPITYLDTGLPRRVAPRNDDVCFGLLRCVALHNGWHRYDGDG